MSKNKKHRDNKEKRANYCDTHHLCYPKKLWRKSYGAQQLREFYYCRVYVPKDQLHNLIHAKVLEVPVPKTVNALDALVQLKYLEKAGAISDHDTIERRLKLLAALFDCVEQPTADAFRAQLRVVQQNKKSPQP